MKKLLFILLITSTAFAQNANRKFISITTDKSFCKIKVSDGSYQIRFLSDKIIETTFIPNGEKYNLTSDLVVLNENKNPNWKISKPNPHHHKAQNKSNTSIHRARNFFLNEF